MTEAQATQAPAATVEIQDLDQFVKILVSWHTLRCKAIQALIEVPEGTTFQVGDDGKDVVLTGPTLAGFVFGLEMAMMQLGTLPFVAELEDEPEVANTAVPG